MTILRLLLSHALSTHSTDNKETRVQQNLVAAFPYRQLETLDVFRGYCRGRMDIDVCIFICITQRTSLMLVVGADTWYPGGAGDDPTTYATSIVALVAFYLPFYVQWGPLER